jgi:maleate isomerase
MAAPGRGDGLKLAAPSRVGVLLPANNAVLELEFAERGGSEAAELLVARLPVQGTGPDELKLMAEHSAAAAGDLIGRGADVLLYACLSTSLVPPFEWDDQLARIVVGASGPPATTAAEATVCELRALGARTVAVVSAYTGVVYDQLALYFARAGLTVTAHATLAIDDFETLGRLEPAELRRFAAEQLPVGADAVCIAGTDLTTLPILADLERDFGVPVVTANGALYNAARRALSEAAA